MPTLKINRNLFILYGFSMWIKILFFNFSYLVAPPVNRPHFGGLAPSLALAETTTITENITS